MIAETNELGHTTKRAYDSRSHRVTTAAPLNRTWQFVHATSTGARGPACCCGGEITGSNALALETKIRNAVGQLAETKNALGPRTASAKDYPDQFAPTKGVERTLMPLRLRRATIALAISKCRTRTKENN